MRSCSSFEVGPPANRGDWRRNVTEIGCGRGSCRPSPGGSSRRAESLIRRASARRSMLNLIPSLPASSRKSFAPLGAPCLLSYELTAPADNSVRRSLQAAVPVPGQLAARKARVAGYASGSRSPSPSNRNEAVSSTAIPEPPRERTSRIPRGLLITTPPPQAREAPAPNEDGASLAPGWTPSVQQSHDLRTRWSHEGANWQRDCTSLVGRTPTTTYEQSVLHPFRRSRAHRAARPRQPVPGAFSARRRRRPAPECAVFVCTDAGFGTGISTDPRRPGQGNRSRRLRQRRQAHRCRGEGVVRPSYSTRFACPREKNPRAALRLVAVHCRRCRVGSYCSTCSGWGFGFRFYLATRDEVRARDRTDAPAALARRPRDELHDAREQGLEPELVAGAHNQRARPLEHPQVWAAPKSFSTSSSS